MAYFQYTHRLGSLGISSHVYRVSTYHYNWHDDIEVLWVLRGSAEVCHDGNVSYLYEDDIIVYSTQCGHATLALEEDTICLVCHVDPESFTIFDKDFLAYRFDFASHCESRNDLFYEEMRYYMAYLMHESVTQDSASPVHRMNFHGVAHQMLQCLYIKICEHRYVQQKSIKVSHQENNFLAMTQYIDTHFRERIELGDIARLGGYSESYASQFFKLQLGISFSEYVSRMRLREAAITLVNTDDLVIHIASECGFSDVKAFNSAFKKHFKKTPREYRQRARQIERQTILEDWKEYISVEDKDIWKKITHTLGSKGTNPVKYDGKELLEKQESHKMSMVKEELQKLLQRLELF